MNLSKWNSVAVLVASLLVLVSAATCARPTATSNRFQRQIVANELASGLTGTGTSFSGYDSYPFQQQTNIQGYDDPLYNNYDNYNQYSKYDRSPYGGSQLGGIVGGGYGLTGGIGGSLGVGGVGGSNWAGFGQGNQRRNPYNRNNNRFGVKY